MSKRFRRLGLPNAGLSSAWWLVLARPGMSSHVLAYPGLFGVVLAFPGLLQLGFSWLVPGPTTKLRQESEKGSLNPQVETGVKKRSSQLMGFEMNPFKKGPLNPKVKRMFDQRSSQLLGSLNLTLTDQTLISLGFRV